jgi:hypothetical protein
MTNHKIGTRVQWLAARRELLDAEKGHARRGDELARQRRELPWVPVEKDYVFETDDGEKTLAELFDGRSQLLVYHLMFGYGDRVDEQSPGCTGCSFVADHFDAAVPHLGGHDVTLVAESIAPLDELHPYKQRMGWRFPRGLIPRQRFQVRLRRRLHRGTAAKRRRVQLPAHRRSRTAGAGDERLRARGRDRVSHLLHLRPRGRAADGNLPLPGPRAAGTQRGGLRRLVAPPR